MLIKEIIKNTKYKKESILQKDICLYLETQISLNKLIYFFSVPNGAVLGGKNNFAMMNMLKSNGLKNGISDLILIFKDKVLFLELKLNHNKLSPEQEKFKNIIQENNINYANYLQISPKNIDELFNFFK